MTVAEATIDKIDDAVQSADAAFAGYRELAREERAKFLESIAGHIENLGDALLQTANRETALPLARLTGERGRTTNQLRMFAALVREGSWRDARIDHALPDRKPVPKPDLRRILIPMGPVGVWAASNFPLAFSVAGGDTASALAAGNPVVLKAHPGHPETSEMVAAAIAQAVRSSSLADGVFSMVQGASPETSVALVSHPLLKAAAFTGSLRAGRALFDAASRREEPIPFFAEMGSVNPVFILPGALEERTQAIADGLTGSINLGVGQFCTCPGLIMGIAGASFDDFAKRLRGSFAAAPAGTMLYPGIQKSYAASIEKMESLSGMEVTKSAANGSQAVPALFETTASAALLHEDIFEEVFGPSAILIRCQSAEEMEKIARRMPGSLTATLHGTAPDLVHHKGLVSILETRVGRLIFNGYPTGVEVCASMQHGGPYPATTDSRFTSVGTAAIQRFARPVCYQDCPPELLPEELLDHNPAGIFRTVDGVLSR
jgi:2,5-dioxopentanoate dehydrogenase